MAKMEKTPVAMPEEEAVHPVEQTVETPVEQLAEQQEEQPVKIVVVQRFRDRHDHKTWFEIGQELFFDSERAGDCVARGLAEFVEPEAN
jgi:hypothetical protein